jgi:selenide,water dikinase
MPQDEPRLTSLAHGGGCGCKLSPSVLQDLLSRLPAGAVHPALLVGLETGDDAAVYRLNDTQALIATTDFFTPIVDDPTEFGRIAATNALSDVYAMGGMPIMALALLGMPLGKISVQTVQRILAGGASVCSQAGIPIAGGHSIDSPEPLYGLVALGLVHPDRILRNSTARDGDVLILTKGLGVGIFSAALKRGELSVADTATMIRSATQLNDVGRLLPEWEGVHAVTDVTGFGLLGHALEMCRGSRVSATIRMEAVPLLPGVEALARAGVATGAAARNWASYGGSVSGVDELDAWQRAILCDPQTSGGLLIAVAEDAARFTLAKLENAGFGASAALGLVHADDRRGGTLRVLV